MQQKIFLHRGFRHTIASISLLALLTIVLAACGALVTAPSPSITATGSTAITHSYPTPVGTKTLYNQPLTQYTSGWATGSTCAFSSRGLAVQPSGGQAYICLVPVTPPPDLSITVTVQQMSGSLQQAYGIVFHHTAPHNYDFFGIDARGHFTLTIVVNNIKHIVLPFTANAAIHQGMNVPNQLQIITRGQQVTMLVNGTPVGQATLSAFASGTVGLRGINDGNVLFHQLVITPV